jgi:hypothetical protein
MFSVQHALEALKLGPRQLIAVGVVCGSLLLLPEKVADFLGIHDFAQKYGQWLGVALIVSVTLLAVNGSEKVLYAVRDRSLRRKAHQRMLKRLHGLTEEEKQILRFYVAKETKTNVLRLDDGVVNGLVAAGIIHRASPFGRRDEFPHNIAELAWECLNQHPEVLVGTTRTYRSDKRQESL